MLKQVETTLEMERDDGRGEIKSFDTRSSPANAGESVSYVFFFSFLFVLDGNIYCYCAAVSSFLRDDLLHAKIKVLDT